MISIKTQRKFLTLAVAAALGSLPGAPALAQETSPPADATKEEKATTLSELRVTAQKRGRGRIEHRTPEKGESEA